MSFRVELSDPVLIHCAPINYATRHWGVYSLPYMWRTPKGDLYIRNNGDMDETAPSALQCAPDVFFRSQDNGDTWQEISREEGEAAMISTHGLVNPPCVRRADGKIVYLRFTKQAFTPLRPALRKVPGPNQDVMWQIFRLADIPQEGKVLKLHVYDPETGKTEVFDSQILYGDLQKGSAFASLQIRPDEPDRWVDVSECMITLNLSALIPLPDGKLLLLVTGQHPGVSDRFYKQLHCLVSDDGGLTWTFRSHVTEYSERTKYGVDEEVGTVRTKDGCIRLAIRTEACIDPAKEYPIADTLYVESWDDGYTWSEPRSISDSSVTPHLVEMEDGLLLCIYGRPGVHCKVSEDGGKTFSDSVSIIGPTLEQARAAGQSDRDSKYFDTSSYSNTFIDQLDENTVLLVYNDMKYDNGDGQEHKAAFVRKIRVVKE